jgi:hypothetical protein
MVDVGPTVVKLLISYSFSGASAMIHIMNLYLRNNFIYYEAPHPSSGVFVDFIFILCSVPKVKKKCLENETN